MHWRGFILTAAAAIGTYGSLDSQITPLVSVRQAQISGYDTLGSTNHTVLLLKERRWFVGQFLKEPVIVEMSDERLVAACNRVKITFQVPTGTKDPISSSALTIADTAKRRCYATYRWKLLDTPGDQVIYATVDARDVDSTFGVRTLQAKAIAHVPAAIVVGVTLVTRKVTDRIPASANAKDSIALRRRFQTFVGADFPILLGLFGSPPAVMDRIRFHVGTALRDPGKDFFAGVSLLPLVEGARQGAFPLQVGFGRRFVSHGQDSFYLSAYFSASAAFGSLLKSFGAS